MSEDALLPEEVEKVEKICRQVLRNDWETHPILIKKLGALQNFSRLLLCSIDGTTEQTEKEKEEAPRKVLVCLNPGVSEFSTLGEAGEQLLFYIFSETKLGPKVYGVLPGARVEQYIASRNLNNDDFENLELCTILTEKSAQIHSLDVPIKRDPQVFFESLHKGAENCSKITVDVDSFDVSLRQKVKDILTMDFEAELDWIQGMVPKLTTRVVFGHNDYHVNNIILRTDNEKGTLRDNLKVIDLETCCYFYRGYEFGTHFMTRRFAFTSDGNMYFGADPAEDKKRFFIGAYLKEWRKLNPSKFDPEMDTVDNILFEAEFFSLTRVIFFLNVMKEWLVTGEGYFTRPQLVEFYWGMKKHFYKTKERMTEKLKQV